MIMKAYEKSPVPRELFGEGTSLQTGQRLKAMDVTKCLVISDQGLVKAGIVAPIVDCIKKEGIEVILFDKVTSEPTDILCVECGNLLIESGAQGVVAIGGGSPMDLAKVAAIMTAIPEKITDLSDYFISGTSSSKKKISGRRKVSSIYIPTTAGTGAESTLGAIITDARTGYKMLLFHAELLPDLAIIDPDLIKGQPRSLMVNCGADVISHCVEHLIGFSQLEFQDIVLHEALRRVWQWLPVMLSDPDSAEARSEVAWAAHQALCNGGNSNSHCLGQSMGGVYHDYGFAHGHACIVALPTSVRWHAETRAREIRGVADCMGIAWHESESNAVVADRVANAIKACYKSMGLKPLQEWFKEKNVPDDKEVYVSKMLDAIKADSLYIRFLPPIHEDEAQARKILEMVWDDV